MCLNWGCIPTKALLYSAGILDSIKNAKQHGVIVEEVKTDYAAAQKNSRRAADRLRKGVEFLMRSNQVTVYEGTARIAAPGKVSVEGKDGATDRRGQKHHHRHGRPAPQLCPAWSPTAKYILTSRDALAMTKLPESMVIIGAGAIGVEFASVFNTFGVKVTLVEALPRILPLEEPEISQELTKLFKKQGIDVVTGAMVKQRRHGQAGRLGASGRGRQGRDAEGRIRCWWPSASRPTAKTWAWRKWASSSTAASSR